MGRWFESWFGDKRQGDDLSNKGGDRLDATKDLRSEGEAVAKQEAFPTLEANELDELSESAGLAATGEVDPRLRALSENVEEVEVPLAKRFRHTLHKGGLEDILANQRLKVNDGNRQIAGGAEAVNAVRAHVDIETLREQMRDLPEHRREEYAKQVMIEFTTDVPCSYHPTYARWTTLGGEVESGGYLPIKVLGVYDGLGNPLPMKDRAEGEYEGEN